MDAEELRLKTNLEAIRYDIDGLDALALVTGSGRIEKVFDIVRDKYNLTSIKCLMPLLYLLLKHHFEIFRIARTRLIHEDEVPDLSDTLAWVADEVTNRVRDLNCRQNYDS